MQVTSAVALAGVPAALPQEFGVAIHVIFVATATYAAKILVHHLTIHLPSS
jgi:hypothetical protein